MTSPGRLLIGITILAFVASLALGQAQPPAGKGVCVFPVTDQSSSTGQPGANAGMEDLDRPGRLQALISQELSAAGFLLVPESKWRVGDNANLSAADLQDPSRLAAIAKLAGADLAVSASFSLQDDRLSLSVSCYDAETGALHAGFSRTWSYNLALFSELHGQIQSLALRLAAPPPTPPAASAPQVASVPGPAQSAAPALTPSSAAQPAVSLTPPAQTGTQAAPAGPRTLRVLETEASWTAGQLIGAGIGFRFYPIPDWLFLGLSFYPYGQAPGSSDGSWLFHLDSGIFLGSYLFFGSDHLLRLGISTGAGFILSKVSSGQADTMEYTDVYLDVLSAWVEVNVPPVSFFLRPELKLALGITSQNLLGTSFILLGNAFVPVTLGTAIRM